MTGEGARRAADIAFLVERAGRHAVALEVAYLNHDPIDGVDVPLDVAFVASIADTLTRLQPHLGRTEYNGDLPKTAVQMLNLHFYAAVSDNRDARLTRFEALSLAALLALVGQVLS